MLIGAEQIKTWVVCESSEIGGEKEEKYGGSGDHQAQVCSFKC